MYKKKQGKNITIPRRPPGGTPDNVSLSVLRAKLLPASGQEPNTKQEVL
jgi:hypothetical protein